MKDPCCKWEQNVCLELTGNSLEARGKRRGTGEGRGDKDTKSQLVRDGCHHCKQGSEETSSAVSALHHWSRQPSSTTGGLRAGTNGALGCKLLQGGVRWKGGMKIYGNLRADPELQHQPPTCWWTGPWINHGYKLITAFLVAAVVSCQCLLLLLTVGRSRTHTEVSPCFCSSLMNTARRLYSPWSWVEDA